MAEISKEPGILAKAVAKSRTEKGLSVNELAALINEDPSLVEAIESGDKQRPHNRIILKLSLYFGWTRPLVDRIYQDLAKNIIRP